jgi:MerR family transcriptional regulator, thiopeptide resistance regulator
MTSAHPPTTLRTLGQVTQDFAVTARTLRHYDAIDLLRPTERTAAGYRLYSEHDLLRLQHIVVYRRLGFSLDEIAVLLDSTQGSLIEHLQRQQQTVQARIQELHHVLGNLEHALQKASNNMTITSEEMKELFGDSFDDNYAQEAHKAWGETDAWKQSAKRTASYSKKEWEEIKAENDQILARMVEAQQSGLLPNSAAAMDTAETHRLHIERWFYDITHEFHRNLSEIYVGDPRFTKTYDDVAPGLARFTRDAIHANADRHQPDL